MADVLVEARHLKKYFPLTGGVFRKVIGKVHAVDDVSFKIYRGETLGVVGESGCGKTTLGRTILRLLEPTAGQIFFEGRDITHLRGKELRELRREMQIVFQDPMASLDPRITIKNSVGEPLVVNGIARGPKMREMVLSLLQKVGLNEDHLNRFPHEFSGGQRQRICIARALALNPKFVVMDEPTSSTDVSVQAQTLNLMKDLQDEFKLTYMFISHNLSVVKHMSDRIAVMYLGKLVETGPTEEVFEKYLDEMRPQLLLEQGDRQLIPLEKLRRAPARAAILFELLSPLGFSPATTGHILKALDSTPGRQFFSPTHRLLKDRDFLIITPLSGEEGQERRYYIEEGMTGLSEPLRLRLTAFERDDTFVIPRDPAVAVIDYDKLSWPLVLRHWQPGDYFRPLGMEGMKKLSDFFIDEKVPRDEKEKIWLITEGDRIVWIPGMRLDDRYKITDDTKKILQIEWLR